MPSLIQQTVQLLDCMDRLQLQCVEQILRTTFESSHQHIPIARTPRLLHIPKELRDRIFYFIGIDHLQSLLKKRSESDYRWIRTTHPLLRVNQQIRREFGEFFCGPHMVRATYLDDSERDHETWRPVPLWLLRALLAAPLRNEDGHFTWIRCKRLSKLNRETAKVKVREALFRDRSADPDIPRAMKLLRLRKKRTEFEEQQYSDTVNNSDACRFHGFLELAGEEHRSPVLATLEFEKYLLSEDQWFKVGTYERPDPERKGLFARSEGHRKHSATMEQRYRAGDPGDQIDVDPPLRVKTRRWPRLGTDGISAEEDTELGSNAAPKSSAS